MEFCAVLLERKDPRNIESKMHIPVCPVAYGLGDVSLLDHGRAVGKMQLEHVAAGFDIKADAEGIAEGIGQLTRKYIDVLGIERHAPAQLDPAAGSQGEDVI